jgi:hypothetical protein
LSSAPLATPLAPLVNTAVDMNTAPKAVAMPLMTTKPSWWWSRLSLRFRKWPALPRAVPVPVGALTQLLDMDATARSRLRHLALVESSCRLSSPDDPFARLPPRAAEIAVRQLDAVLPQHPALRVLRLQLERHLQSHRAHVSAMLAVEDRKWQIEGSVVSCSASLAGDSMIGGPYGVTDFLETQPFETATLRRF